MLEIGLIGIIVLVLVLPLFVHFVEHNLELFLFIMGVAAMSVSHFWGPEPMWSLHIVGIALKEPLLISAAVIVFGIIIYVFRSQLENSISFLEKTLSRSAFAFLVIFLLGIFSSIITAIIAAILLVEIISVMHYDREHELKIIVLGCFAIGLGAALTPIGEPLSTILVAKLRGAPYYADFFFPLRLIGVYVIPGIFVLACLGAYYNLHPDSKRVSEGFTEKEKDTVADIFIRGGKVYVFIVALVLLGEGFKPMIDRYLVRLPNALLYWINTVSAVLDNATLTAAEISPKMGVQQIQYILMGLLIAGGMLIPGNIPNIIAAGRLKIKSKDWARIGLPLGGILMVVYFIIFEVVNP